MITKNYTADRTETPGDATSTIPAAMANYWINGVNSLISDLTPLKDAGGFYAPVDFSIFRATSNTSISANVQIPLTKMAGNMSLSGNNIVLTKGYFYEIIFDFNAVDASVGPSRFWVNITDTSNNILSQRANMKLSATGGADDNSAIGYALLDQTGAGSDIQVKVLCTANNGTTNIQYQAGGVYVKKHKLIPFTAAT